MLPLLTSIAFVLIGLLLLVKGSDFFIDGAAEIAKRIGVSEIIIGLTLVAFATSLPEWVSSLIAAFRDPNTLECLPNTSCNTTDLALGNVLGSNITNIGLVIGCVGLLLPKGITVNKDFLLRDIPIIIILSISTWYFALQDNLIGRWEGFVIFFGFLYVMFQTIRKVHHPELEEQDIDFEESEEESVDDLSETPSWKLYALTGGGLLGLLIGSNLLVEGASDIALSIGVPEAVVGLTMVAFGTSVPELATSITAGKRGKHAMLIGGIIGSNSANLAIILGSVSFLIPVQVQGTFTLYEFPVMVAFISALWVFMISGKIERWHSAILLIGYLVFTTQQFL